MPTKVGRPAVPVPGQLADPGGELPADDVRLPAEPYEVDPEIVRALDMLLILHADHEQNCSTSTVRLVGSSQANLFTSISGGINACGVRCTAAPTRRCWRCWKIRVGQDDVQTFVKEGQEQRRRCEADGLRPPGLQNYDPRARIVKEQADKILGKLGGDDELLDIAKALEEIALTDDFFIERKLYPNVDYYTGVIYRAMGFPGCSPCCSPWAGCPAGSRTGGRCTRSRTRSAGPGRSTPVTPRRDYTTIDARCRRPRRRHVGSTSHHRSPGSGRL